MKETPQLASALGSAWGCQINVVVAVVQVQLVRTAVNMTNRRPSLGEVSYDYLMIKETAIFSTKAKGPNP